MQKQTAKETGGQKGHQPLVKLQWKKEASRERHRRRKKRKKEREIKPKPSLPMAE